MTRQGLHNIIYKASTGGLFNTRRVFYIITLLFCLTACRGTREVVETKYETVYVDSVVTRDSTIYIPVERYVDIVNQLDTLKLQTSLSEAYAYLDTSMNMLRGEIRNKQQVQYKYIDRWHDRVRDTVIYETKTEYVDKPVYVKNPTNTGLVIWTVLSGIGIIAFIVWKVYKLLSHFQ